MMASINLIITILGGIILTGIGLTGLLNKPFMDKLGFSKLGKKYYIISLAIGAFLLISTLLNYLLF